MCGQSFACLAATYGVLMDARAVEFARTHQRWVPVLGYLYGLTFAAAAFLLAQESSCSFVEQQRTLPFWAALVLLLSLTMPVGIWGDTAVFRPGTALGSGAMPSRIILRQMIEAFVLLSLWDDLPWKGRLQEPRPSSLRDRRRGEAAFRP